MDVNKGKMKNKALDLLIRSLDNPLSAAEQKLLDQQLESSEALRRGKAQLLKMRAELAQLKADAQPGFAEQLIRQLNAEEAQSDNPPLQAVIMRLFPKVAAACVIVVVLTVLATFFTEGSLSLEAFIGIQDLSPEDAYTLLDQ